MMLALLLLISSALVATRFFFVKKGVYLPTTVFRILLAFHFCLFLMSVSTFVLARYNLYWRGYRSTSIIIILTAFTGLLCVWLSKSKPFIIFTFFVFIETMLSVILVWDITDGYHENLYYNDAKYRLENTDRFIMAHPSLPDLFVKKGLFEKEYELRYIYPAYMLHIRQVKVITVKEITENKVSISFTHTADSIYHLANPLIVEIDLNK